MRKDWRIILPLFLKSVISISFLKRGDKQLGILSTKAAEAHGKLNAFRRGSLLQGRAEHQVFNIDKEKRIKGII